MSGNTVLFVGVISIEQTGFQFSSIYWHGKTTACMPRSHNLSQQTINLNLFLLAKSACSKKAILEGAKY